MRPPTGVLVTRPEPGAADTAARLAALGWQPILAPCLAIAPRAPPLPAPGRLQAILVASGQAIPALPASHHALPLLAVGDATARRAREAGFANVTSADGDAAALLALVRQRLTPTGAPVLLAAGAGQSLKLAANLRQAGFRVLRRVVYEQRKVPTLPEAALGALAAHQLAAVLFFSGATARHFGRILPERLHPCVAQADALAIGRSAADAVRHLPWRAVRVALHPNQDELLALLPSRT